MRKSLRVAIVGLSFFAPICPLLAQTYAIKADRLIDGMSDAVRQNITIIVSDGKIAAMGERVDVPENAIIIDLGDKTVLPGFIDAHTHIMSQGVEEYGNQLYRRSTAYRAIEAVAAARTALWNGFTAMRDVESEGAMYADADVKNAINAGIIPGPRMWVSTRGLSIVGRYFPFGYSWELDLPKGTQMVAGPEECLRAVRQQVAGGADWIKVYADWRVSIAEDGGISGLTNFTEEELRVVVNEAHRLDRKVAAHANSREGIKAALDARVDSIEHGDGLDEALIAQAKAQGVYLCPTILAYEHAASQGSSAASEQKLRVKYAGLQAAHDAGLRIALGSDAGSYP